MSEASKPIFVIGGTGRHGGTGAYVARQLLKLGMPVRALVRQRDDRARSLEELGAEVVVGDLHDRRSLIPALDGTFTAYFTYPIAGGIVDAAANFASAARVAGLKRLVVMSMAPATPDSPSHWGAPNGWRRNCLSGRDWPASICASPPCSLKILSCCTARISRATV
jgi:uncharacterized protein YbjT (DUF2867 family)